MIVQASRKSILIPLLVWRQTQNLKKSVLKNHSSEEGLEPSTETNPVLAKVPLTQQSVAESCDQYRVIMLNKNLMLMFIMNKCSE